MISLLTYNQSLLYIILAIFSLAIGSLLNLMIYRLPRMLEREHRAACAALNLAEITTEASLNLFFPRSFCTSCLHTIKAIHNIPVISYLWLRGRCAYCKAPIPIRYPLIEGLTCLLSLYSAYHFGFNLSLIFALLFVWSCIVLFVIDLHTQLLPDNVTLTLLWIGLLANTLTCFTPLESAVIGAAIAYLSLWIMIQLFYGITGKVGMGNGDFKLFAAFGAWFGWAQLPIILFMAALSGAIIGGIYLKLGSQSKDTPLPFGPFLCTAGIINLFWGHAIMQGYFKFIM